MCHYLVSRMCIHGLTRVLSNTCVHAFVSRYVLYIRSEFALQAGFVYTRVFASQVHRRMNERSWPCVGRANSKSTETKGIARAQREERGE